MKTQQEVHKDDFRLKSKVTEKAQLMGSKESNGKCEQLPMMIPNDDDPSLL